MECPRCKKEKDRFYKNDRYCKDCRNAYRDKYIANNRGTMERKYGKGEDYYVDRTLKSIDYFSNRLSDYDDFED